MLAYGIAKGVEQHGSTLATWRIIFLVTGLLTVVIGVIFLFTVPDSQLNARFLKPEDRTLAVERVRVNRQGIGNKHFKFYQFKEALTDPLTWTLCFFSLVGDIPNGGLTNFFSQLVRNLGLLPLSLSKCNAHVLIETGTDRQLWIQSFGGPIVWRSCRSRRGSHPDFWRLASSQIWSSSAYRWYYTADFNLGHLFNVVSATFPQRRTACRVLYDADESYVRGCSAIPYIVERCRVYEKDNGGRHLLHRILCWQPDRYVNLCCISQD